jgi:hypothetical protein
LSDVIYSVPGKHLALHRAYNFFSNCAYARSCMRQVLTMEYVPGIKINRIAALDELGVDRKRYVNFALNNGVEQIESFA